MTRLHAPQKIVVMLHAYRIDVDMSYEHFHNLASRIAMDVVRFAPQGAHNLETQVTCYLTENEERRCCLFYSKEDGSCCYCLIIVPRVLLLKKTVRLLHIIDNKAPPPARDSGEVTVHEVGVVILKPESADTIGVRAVAYPCM